MEQSEYIGAEEAARLLGVSRRTITRYLAAGKLEGFQLPGEQRRHWRISVASIERLKGGGHS